MIPSSIAFLFTFVFWKLIRRLLGRSPVDNVAGPKSGSFFTGSLVDVFNPDQWDFHQSIIENYGGVAKIAGPFGSNWLYVFDPKAIYHIIIKEHHIFDELASFIEGNKILFGHGLLSVSGEQHRKQRKILNPVFSVAHMREITPTFYNVGHKLLKTFTKKVENGHQEIDMLEWMSRASLELIGQSGLGFSFDDLSEDQTQHEYAKLYKDVIPTASNFFFVRDMFLIPWLKFASPTFSRMVVDCLPGKNVRYMKYIVDFLHNTSVRIYESRKKVIAGGGDIDLTHGKDVMSILMKATMNASEENRLREDELIAQITTLTIAATDTTSNALSRTLHLLAQHPEVQERLRREIIDAKEYIEGDLNYDQLDALPFMDAICRETLRLYSPGAAVTRIATEDTVIPLYKPVRGVNGKELKEICVRKGTNVVVSILASNRNPDLWGPDVLEWKPERWLQPLPSSVTDARVPGVYSNLMTFLGGGRACIGFKFALLEMKVILSLLIESFRISLTTKEIHWQTKLMTAPHVVDADGNFSAQLPILMERVDAK